MKQDFLFDRQNPEGDPDTPAIVQRPAHQRVNPQCQAILDLLRKGRASNYDLARVALKYSSRITDLRHAGYDVRCVEHDHATGVAWYELKEGA